MKMKSFSLIVAGSLLGWSVGNASVTDVTDPGWSGGLYCYFPLALVDNSGDLTMGATETGSGRAWATILTSSASDPTLSINNTVDNDSAFAWTEYIVNVSLNTNFTILSAAATAPPGWTANITQPGAPVGGIYTGTIDYLGGTPVANITDADNPPPDSQLIFAYQIRFSGLTQYSLTESVMPVPEPGTLGFLMVGGLLLRERIISRRR